MSPATNDPSMSWFTVRVPEESIERALYGVEVTDHVTGKLAVNVAKEPVTPLGSS